jgi:carotenoid cleavage dioxygenase-like enzyme
MPEICRFLGIVITMYFDEHNPPHLHVRYNEYRASIEIESLNVMTGRIPARVRGLVEEWAELHRRELLAMWASQEFHKLDPLV